LKRLFLMLAAALSAILFTACAPAAVTTTGLDGNNFAPDHGFDRDWRFARFGAMPDGTREVEPGESKWTVRLSASSNETERGHEAFMAMDGTADTRWCASDGSPNQWLALDLGKPQALGTMTIEWDVTSGWKQKQLPYAFVVEGSTDGKSWAIVEDHTQPAPNNPVSVKVGATYRSLRVRTTAIQPGQWASIREITLTDAQGKAITNRMLPAGADMPSSVNYDDSAWRKLDIPHDWAIEGPFRIDLAGDTGKLPWKGIGWYRKHFAIPAADSTKRIFVDFDGAMAYAQIWCNGQYVGTWPYGYSSFRMDVTPYCKFGQENILAVRLDTEKWDSRWYPGAGIYRYVRLVKTAPVHVGHWGTFVTTPAVTDATATVNLAVTVDNQGEAAAKARVRTDIYELGSDGAAGAKVASAPEVTLEIAAGSSSSVTQQARVPNPKRWELDHPNRYIARTIVSFDGQTVDTYDTKFGIRTLKFTPRDGFLLNGKRVEIQGTCNHADSGALGIVVNERALERQLEILKAMGCNSLRTSHNPPAPELLELADRMGFLVWDEAFDCWANGKRANDYNKLYAQWHVKDLQALTHRDRNHPSVFIWSIGNEVMDQENVEMTRHLVDVVHAEDPTRPVSNGYNNPDGGRNSGACMALDIMGINYFFGNQTRYDNDPRYKDKPTIGSETSSCISSRGEYFFPGDQTHWQVNSYDQDRPGWGCPPDAQFATLARLPHVLGEYVWTGFDYLGEPTPYNSDVTNLLNFRTDPTKRAELAKELERLARSAPPSRSSYFGIVDLAGFPKDRYYLYQSHWRPELPMAHILPHWNWPDRVGKVTPVQVYTSGDEAELFLNGKSLGRKKKGQFEYRLRWNDVKYEPGELKVVAYKEGKEWARDVVKTTQPASQLVLAADRATIKNDGEDLSFITVRVADPAGLTIPRASNLVKFSIEGPGEIVATDNGDATSFESFQAHEHKAYNGLCLVVVRAKRGETGMFRIKAASDGLAGALVQINAKP
jgi:beta-galactosidase